MKQFETRFILVSVLPMVKHFKNEAAKIALGTEK
jgi:hypothetical protein